MNIINNIMNIINNIMNIINNINIININNTEKEVWRYNINSGVKGNIGRRGLYFFLQKSGRVKYCTNNGDDDIEGIVMAAINNSVIGTLPSLKKIFKKILLSPSKNPLIS